MTEVTVVVGDGTCGGCGQPTHESDAACWWIDLGECQYFRRHHRIEPYDPEATCGFGCIDEPECVTGRPSGGWPSETRSISVIIPGPLTER